jgi:hypothetical protein
MTNQDRMTSGQKARKSTQCNENKKYKASPQIAANLK